MEVVTTTGALRRAKLQWNPHHQQTNTQLSTGRMPLSTNGVEALKGKALYNKKLSWCWQQARRV